MNDPYILDTASIWPKLEAILRNRTEDLGPGKHLPTSMPLHVYKDALKNVRLDLISIESRIRDIDLVPSSWASGREADRESRLRLCSALCSMAAAESWKPEALRSLSQVRVAKARRFLDQNQEFKKSSLPAPRVNQLPENVPPVVSSYFPDLKTQLDGIAIPTGETWDLSSMECALCHEPLVFQGTIGPDMRPRPHVTRTPSQEGEIAIVLPCAHIVGKGCLDILRRKKMAGCPFCQAKLHYCCGHVFEDLPAPETRADLDLFPFPFHGLVRSCDVCLWNEFKHFTNKALYELLKATAGDAESLNQLQSYPEPSVVDAAAGNTESVARAPHMRRRRLALALCFLAEIDPIVEAAAHADQLQPTWAIESPLARSMRSWMFGS